MKNYVAENVSTTSLTTVKCGLKVLSNGSESIIFMFIGISTVNDFSVRFTELSVKLSHTISL